MASKTLGTTNKIAVSYTYNTQGQLLTIKSTPFSQELRYNTYAYATKYYNGNISSIQYQHSGQSSNCFTFGYDNLNRLTSNMKHEASSSTTPNSRNKLTETGFTYDVMGNITKFTRYDVYEAANTYTLTYNTCNQLTKASSTKGKTYTFSYDQNGNALNTTNGLTLTYNTLNLPYQAKSGSTLKYQYNYLADGRKTEYINDKTTTAGRAYHGSIVYNMYQGQFSFESTDFAGERITGNYAVQYHITDHLGNVRTVLNNSMTILEQNDYYPFGQRHPNPAMKTTTNRYRYNSKEQLTETEAIDYGARWL